MKSYPIHIEPFGKSAVLVAWPNQVEESILQDILEFANNFRALKLEGWELVIAYNSITMIQNDGILDFGEIKELILECHSKPKAENQKKERYLWRIPVCYEREFGIDIDEVAETLNLSPEQLIDQHTSQQYIVYGIGFLPGFMYLGGLPSSLEIPRRAEPRLNVSKGSVGLAGKQTGIYPQDSPGGWNIIGNCPIPLFDSSRETPCFVSVGDKVQFYEISKAEYDLRIIEAEVGIYKLEKLTIDA
ncbi:5-oxoprolinase subunit PxpB [Flagellimonas nanhaiensis]|uniref:Allophanate hydrolase subunit 1 n=1 Tax=Flagellimonas nanhaiensis TaxID=2292706 RepID=A0A371JUC8_9FLAO|nr:5-oxoprolinase subunit PxpB [Allomuricauda nanhaiensis]RDY61421.1 allophanate hydrolase subunit 1 [Allomuricauda nanhaiensis]